MSGPGPMLPLPAWIARILPPDFWVTISPTIYHPRGIDPERYPTIILHEQVHLRQQSSGLSWWLLRYLLSRRFRLEAEAEAYAAEIAAMPERARAARLAEAAAMLSGREYFWCAGSATKAEGAIRARMGSVA